MGVANKSSKSFSSKWLHPGATILDKDCLQKHVLSLQHQEAVKLSKKSKLGSEAYKQLVVEKAPIRQSLKSMWDSDEKSLNVKFNCVYCLAKHERPYSDYPILLSLHERKEVKVGTSYLNDRAATYFTYHIPDVTCESLQKQLFTQCQTMTVERAVSLHNNWSMFFFF